MPVEVTLDAEAINVNLGGNIITGWADVPNLDPVDPAAWKTFHGLNGQVVRVKNRNKAKIMTLKILQGHNDNATLLRLAEANEIFTVDAYVNNEFGIRAWECESPQAYVHEEPTSVSFATDGSSMFEWKVMCHDAKAGVVE